MTTSPETTSPNTILQRLRMISSGRLRNFLSCRDHVGVHWNDHRRDGNYGSGDGCRSCGDGYRSRDGGCLDGHEDGVLRGVVGLHDRNEVGD